jgi:hypothetical protein
MPPPPKRPIREDCKEPKNWKKKYKKLKKKIEITKLKLQLYKSYFND